MKKVLVDMLRDAGFTEQPIRSEVMANCNGLILQREWSMDTEVAFYGKVTSTFKVEVFVNQNSGICQVSYSKDGRRPYKSRWHDTVGKRTYNAIVETARCAGYAI